MRNTLFERAFPSFVLVVIVAIYAAMRLLGIGDRNGPFVIAALAGVVMYLIAVMISMRPESHDLQANPRILWIVGFSVAGPLIVTVQSYDILLALAVIVMVIAAAASLAIMIGRYIIGPDNPDWWMRDALIPIAIAAASVCEYNGKTAAALACIVIFYGAYTRWKPTAFEAAVLGYRGPK